MKKWEDNPRTVWSCRFWELPEEDETAQLEQELKGRNLHYAEDALTLQRYIRLSGCSQEEAAKRLGRAQSTVANRLRLLKLPVDVLEELRESELSERHGRALLRLSEPEQQRQALQFFCRERLSAAAAEAYVDALPGKKGLLRCAAIQDLEALLTSLNRDLETLRRCGITVTTTQRETPEQLVLTVCVSKEEMREKTLEKS